MLRIIKVTGDSLSPFFLSGDYVIIQRRAGRFSRLGPGDAVVVDHPLLGLLIKNIRRNHPDRKCLELEGSHPDSISTEKMGLVDYQDILGKVILRIPQRR